MLTDQRELTAANPLSLRASAASPASPVIDETGTRARLGLVLALLAAGLLRFWALPHGVPFSLQVDEPEVLVRAVRMMKTGDLNPHFYDYPTLYMYLQAVV